MRTSKIGLAVTILAVLTSMVGAASVGVNLSGTGPFTGNGSAQINATAVANGWWNLWGIFGSSSHSSSTTSISSTSSTTTVYNPSVNVSATSSAQASGGWLSGIANFFASLHI
jgi:hypothetical protein